MSETGATIEELIARLRDGGHWPEPNVLEALVERRGAAVDALRELVMGEVVTEADRSTHAYAADLLGLIGDPRCLPELAHMLRVSDDDWIDGAPSCFVGFGPAVLEPLLEIIRDDSLESYPRCMASEIARGEVAGHTEAEARLAAELMGLLSSFVTAAGSGKGEAGPWTKVEEVEIRSLVSGMVSDLASLGCAESRPLIDRAFELGLVDRIFIDEAEVATDFERASLGSRPPGPRLREPQDAVRSYINEYRSSHRAWKRHGENWRDRRRAEDADDTLPFNELIPFEGPGPAAFEDEPPPVVAPIRKTGPQLGRNDECWCGSGRKYKKCHMKADQGQ
jgi:hypothetical protein